MFFGKKKPIEIIEKEEVVRCEETKCLLNKKDAYVVTIGMGTPMDMWMTSHRYYSPKFAPKYDTICFNEVRNGNTSFKYYKSVPKSFRKVNVK